MAGTQAFSCERGTFFRFDPDKLEFADGDHTLADRGRTELPLEENLVLSIMADGVLEPVIVRKEGDRAIVIDGRQRVKCAREANRRLRAAGKEPVTVPAIQRKGDEIDAYGVMISANEIRIDDGPLARAQKCAKYLAMGRSEQQAAITFGVTTQCIKQWMRLLECAPPVRRAVEQHKLSASAASQLAKLEPEKQAKELEGLLRGGNGKRPTAKQVARATGKPAGPRMRGRREIEKRLDAKDLPGDMRKALRWVLGETETLP